MVTALPSGVNSASASTRDHLPPTPLVEPSGPHQASVASSTAPTGSYVTAAPTSAPTNAESVVGSPSNMESDSAASTAAVDEVSAIVEVVDRIGFVLRAMMQVMHASFSCLLLRMFRPYIHVYIV